MSLAAAGDEPIRIEDFLRDLYGQVSAIREQLRLRLFALECSTETPEETEAIEDALKRVANGEGFLDALSGADFAQRVRESAAARA